MDRTIVILLIVLAIVMGVFLVMSSGSDGGGAPTVTGFASSAGQYGGGCGR